jgi:hypothetical protein
MLVEEARLLGEEVLPSVLNSQLGQFLFANVLLSFYGVATFLTKVHAGD